uniref:Uncharacterized protein n=1 Tax=Megaselia scalaris TaxID=36166 RepID=T1GAS0_MEGSC
MKLIKSFVVILLFAVTFAVDYRLKTNVVPNSYNITIQPYVRQEDGDQQFTFDGKVDIFINVAEDNVSEIEIHKKNLIILSVEVLFNNNVVPDYLIHPYDDMAEAPIWEQD